MSVPEDFAALYPKLSVAPIKGPIYWLWVFNPEDGEVTLEHNEGRHKAYALTHDDLAKKVGHPNRVHGFAYPIVGGYRITDEEHKGVDDPYVLKKVQKALTVRKDD